MSAQQISGVVSSEKGEKLPGVSVLLKGTARGTTTDANGKFSLDAKSGQTVVFSFSRF
ncbi:carboxypeptidase-like regulatory domain-containing protein [Runella sp. CRIBMP]|uniref:carboxypeptidase-like regulatory domain-containing protein n=1 Tax=Runella sp. CRIBMP TaxID=2683261 RepID=UPI00197DDE83|nr:carboxypeptidase-like regulatory domain-containing protein [Runella sp. CRIBMP]